MTGTEKVSTRVLTLLFLEAHWAPWTVLAAGHLTVNGPALDDIPLRRR